MVPPAWCVELGAAERLRLVRRQRSHLHRGPPRQGSRGHGEWCLAVRQPRPPVRAGLERGGRDARAVAADRLDRPGERRAEGAEGEGREGSRRTRCQGTRRAAEARRRREGRQGQRAEAAPARVVGRFVAGHARGGRARQPGRFHQGHASLAGFRTRAVRARAPGCARCSTEFSSRTACASPHAPGAGLFDGAAHGAGLCCCHRWRLASRGAQWSDARRGDCRCACRRDAGGNVGPADAAFGSASTGTCAASGRGGAASCACACCCARASRRSQQSLRAAPRLDAARAIRAGRGDRGHNGCTNAGSAVRGIKRHHDGCAATSAAGRT